MNTGIGDAFNLAWKLAQTIKGRIDPAVLDTYEPERIAFARTLVESTDRAFQGLVGAGVVGRLVRTLLAPRVLGTVTRFTVGRRAMFRTVSQIRIAYPQSALSEGRVGAVRAGDRLPWVAEADGAADNYKSLQSLDWQAHIYGEATAGATATLVDVATPLHRFAWTVGAEAAGFVRGAVYLIRPDGHVALASNDASGAALKHYLRAWQLDVRQGAAATSTTLG